MNLSDLVAETTKDDIKKKILDAAKGAGLKVTTWADGDPSMVLIAIIATVIYIFTTVIRDAIRSQFLDLATDPGDDGTSEPAKGWLSWKGEGDYNTPRIDSTFANGTVKLTNSGGLHVFGPDEVTFQNNVTGKTYRNSYDPLLYVGPDRLLTLSPGAIVEIPVLAEEKGAASNAAPGEVSVIVSTLIGVTVTNDAAILGSDREPRARYIERCKIAQTATSPNGPADAYRYIATSAREDGTWGNQPSSAASLGCTRVQVTRNSVYGLVSVWYASDAGAMDPGKFTALDAILQANYNPDCVTYTGFNASEVTIPITYTVEASTTPGVSAQIIKDAVAAALASYFKTIPIGGFKNNGTSGTLFLARLRAEIGKAHPAIFNVTVSLPAGDTTLNNGQVAKPGTITGTVTFS